MSDSILIRAQMRRLEELVVRLHVSMAGTEREAMGLHAGLVEAIRRLHALEQPIDDLKLVLDNPGSAPLNWRGGNPRPTHIRSREEWSNEYERIFGQEQ
jgi:hypothetical protein